jgi:hypothetical protein
MRTALPWRTPSGPRTVPGFFLRPHQLLGGPPGASFAPPQ